MIVSAASRLRLQGVHLDLVKVVERAALLIDADGGNLTFRVTEGVRTKERQAQLMAAGASQTMNSRHLSGHAVDLAAEVSGVVRWDWPCYIRIANTMRRAALDLGLPVVWGGTWKPLSTVALTAADLSKGFPDGPHFELDRLAYPT